MQQNGERCSAATAFLDPVKKRPNLKVVTGAQAHKIHLTAAKGGEKHNNNGGLRAEGVRVGLGEEVCDVALNRGGEVIVSAGAVVSPQLLLLSGIGADEQLKAHGISSTVSLPHVGQHLQDHPACVVSYSSLVKGVSVTSLLRLGGGKLSNPKPYVQWLAKRAGLLTSTGCDHGGFFKTRADLEQPDLQIRFLAARALSPDGMSTYSTVSFTS